MPALIIFIIFAFLSTYTLAQKSDNKSQNLQEQANPKALPETPSKHTTDKRNNFDNSTAAPNKTLEQFKGYDDNGNEVLCSKDQAEPQTIDGKTVYRCRSKSEALGEDNKSVRGESETNELIDNLLEQSKQAPEQRIKLNPEQIKQIKNITDDAKLQDSSPAKASPMPTPEKPETIQLQKLNKENTEKPPIEPTVKSDDNEQLDEGESASLMKKSEKIPVKAYVSLRLNGIYSDNDWDISDGGSRGGLIYAHKFASNDELIAHVEFGSNVFDQVENALSHSDVGNDKKINRRLSYIRYGRDDYYTVFGKNWSVYHYIAGMTDRFIAVGGKASAIYNAKTDGGASGTGRADNAIQLRSSRGMVQWGMQLQTNNAIPEFKNVNYDLAAALMFKLKTESGFGIGSAINRAIPEQYTTDMIAANLDGNSSAHTIGIEWDYFQWYTAMVFSQSQNQVTDDKLQYYDARGLELYSSRQITDRQMLRLGFNMQKPDEPDDYLGEHQIEEYYLSWQYNYNSSNKKDILFSEYAYNRGRLADGSRPANRWVIGVRYHWQN